jgi:hypothetical protein
VRPLLAILVTALVAAGLCRAAVAAGEVIASVGHLRREAA